MDRGSVAAWTLHCRTVQAYSPRSDCPVLLGRIPLTSAELITSLVGSRAGRRPGHGRRPGATGRSTAAARTEPTVTPTLRAVEEHLGDRVSLRAAIGRTNGCGRGFDAGNDAPRAGGTGRSCATRGRRGCGCCESPRTCGPTICGKSKNRPQLLVDEPPCPRPTPAAVSRRTGERWPGIGGDGRAAAAATTGAVLDHV